MMYAPIQAYCENLVKEFDKIPAQRKHVLEKIAAYSAAKMKRNKPVLLVYLCTHNSRRSHFGQIWASVASAYYRQPVKSFSGGTEATAFNSNAINALKRVGFDVMIDTGGKNPVCHLKFDDQEKPVACFSKVYDHPANPRSEFAAIMTCSDAAANCPFVAGAELSVATTYDDPKAADNTPVQDATYDARCRQVAREVFYVFFKIKSNNL